MTMVENSPSPNPSSSALKRWIELVEQINAARVQYSLHTSQFLTDSEYDLLYRELVELEIMFPILVTGDSPTQSVGGNQSDLFDPVIHLEPMYSLDNAFSPNELEAWYDKLCSTLDRNPQLLCELKIDGLAVDAVYRDGDLYSLSTRGDGTTGEDVNAKCWFYSCYS